MLYLHMYKGSSITKATQTTLPTLFSLEEIIEES
jgi:hypothetical protein